MDYFAVGVMAFECMFGKVSIALFIFCQRPYVGKSRQEIRDHILSKQIQIKKNEVPKGWSLEAADFINKVTFHSLNYSDDPEKAIKSSGQERASRSEDPSLAERLSLARPVAKKGGVAIYAT